MKRVEVWREGHGEWFVECHESERTAGQHLPIAWRKSPGRLRLRPFPTHTAALAHALVAVGLTTPPEHREAP